MKCQKCGKREANTHIKKVVNGEYEELMLCRDCAHAMGYDNVFSLEMPDMFGGLLQSFLGSALPARSGASRCPVCGSTYGDITNTGKVGCANCYEAFYSELLPSIKRIHGNTQHSGKVPQGIEYTEVKEEKKPEDVLSNLKAQLKKAVEEQNFELATELRDKINAKEAEK